MDDQTYSAGVPPASNDLRSRPVSALTEDPPYDVDHTHEYPPLPSGRPMDNSTTTGNRQSYAARMQTKPGLTVATSAQNSVDPPYLSPISPSDPEYPLSSPADSSYAARRTTSVTDRSPLQRLEGHFGDITKEEKRARLQAAEQAARQRGAERVTRKPVDTNAANTRRSASQRKSENSATNTSFYDAGLDDTPKPHSRNISSGSADMTQSQPKSNDRVSRSYSQRYGHDSALTGGAAAAALGAFQAVRQQKPLPPLPRAASKGGAISTRPSQPPLNTAAATAQPRNTSYGSNDKGLPMSPDQGPSPPPKSPYVHTQRSVSQPAQYSTGYQNHQPSNTVNSQAHDPSQPPKRRVGFDAPESDSESDARHHRFTQHFHRGGRGSPDRYEPPKYNQDWRTARSAELGSEDLDSDTEGGTNQPWWEKGGARGRSPRVKSEPIHDSSTGGYEAETGFNPPLMLKCGPLLRYTGIKTQQSEKEPNKVSAVWTGSVMIVTEDEKSSYNQVPTLQLFKQPKPLFVPQTKQIQLDDGRVVSEYVDALAGEVKLSRTGHPLYVKSLNEIHGGIDLSRDETNNGLFSSEKPNRGQEPMTQALPKGSRVQETPGFKLHAERGFTFWRFNLKIHLRDKQHRVAYRINGGPAIGFWVPAKEQSMNIMFHSCNGFSLSVNPNDFSGPDPLWRDVLNHHQVLPFHVLIGGGDQLYNDAAMKETRLFQDWLSIKNPEHKHWASFTKEMQDELEKFYLNRYAMWFSQGFFGMANSQIPMVNIWDDHDIIDGFGSYPDHFMRTPVFSGVGMVAHKYYMLFQHQSVPDETEESESSWLLGSEPGPYIKEQSRSLFMSLGKGIAFLGLDCRTERRRDRILSRESYDNILDRCEDEITKGFTRHLIVLLGVPIAYPRLNFLENVLTSRFMDPIKALGRTGLLGGFVNKFDGGVEILDDLDDHWTAKHHKRERNWFIQELQALAADKSIRVTILGGDVHLGAVGQFYSNKKLAIPKHKDHRYMPNVVSSAIVNTPPPEMMADIINKRNKVHHLDHDTDEDMIAMFNHDVDGKNRNNVHLLPRRNWCSIRAFNLDHVPVESIPPAAFSPEYHPPPRRRSFSLTRRSSSASRSSSADGRPGLIHRISRGRAPPSSYKPPTGPGQYPAGSRGSSMDRQRISSDNLSVQSSMLSRSQSLAPEGQGNNEQLTLYQSSEQSGPVNLEGGLQVVLNMEVNQKDPAGVTQPYTLLIPALFYDPSAAPPVSSGQREKVRNLFRFGSFRRKKVDDYSHEPPPTQQQMQEPQRSIPQSNGGQGYSHEDDGELSDNEEFQDAYETHHMPAVISTESPVPESRAVSDAMQRSSASTGAVLPDSAPSRKQPPQSPSSQWNSMQSDSLASGSRQASSATARNVSSSTVVQTAPQSRVVSDASTNRLNTEPRSFPGPLTANPPTPSNANVEVSQTLPRLRPSSDASQSASMPQEYNTTTKEGSGVVYGPPRPANYDQLPDSVKKRYDQYTAPREIGTQPLPPPSSHINQRRVQSGPAQSRGPWPSAQPAAGNNYENRPVNYQHAQSPAQAPVATKSNTGPARQDYRNSQSYQQAPAMTPGSPQAYGQSRASWQAPSPQTYDRPRTPPRNSRAMFHDEDALNELLGNGTGATKHTDTRQVSAAAPTPQTQAAATTPGYTYPANYPYQHRPASPVQTDASPVHETALESTSEISDHPGDSYLPQPQHRVNSTNQYNNALPDKVSRHYGGFQAPPAQPPQQQQRGSSYGNTTYSYNNRNSTGGRSASANMPRYPPTGGPGSGSGSGGFMGRVVRRLSESRRRDPGYSNDPSQEQGEEAGSWRRWG